MKAVVAHELNRIAVEQVELDRPRAQEVKIKMAAAGVCHSDLSILNGTIPSPFPIVLGHEGAGVVEEVGEGVTHTKAGDHVVMSFVPNCGRCFHCARHEAFLCRATPRGGMMPDGTSRLKLADKALAAFCSLGNMAEYVVCPAMSVVPIAKDVPLQVAALIGCGVTTGVGAVIFTAKVEAGANVVVFGLGGIGLNVIQGARMVGADKVIGIDINPKREALGRQFGMTHFINPKHAPNVVDAIVQLTDGGADYSFECIGNTTTMRQALECCHKGWGVSTIIGVAGAGEEISTRPFQLVTGRVWKGSAFGGARGRTDVPRIVDWYMDGKLRIDELITHKLPLERINEGFGLMERGESIRSVVVY
jgi:S-(hydroxymethyl)glutathione dehydrogenase/alcohol dehydrogenase